MRNQRSANTTVVHIELPTRADFRRAARFAALAGLTAVSAIVVKEYKTRADLPALAQISSAKAQPTVVVHRPGITGSLLGTLLPVEPAAEEPGSASEPDGKAWLNDPTVRYFNDRPIRPARTLTMLVTAYSPDWRSCDDSADGVTASIHSVDTNDGKLVAADTRVLPLGSMISIPGYDSGSIVPVLDRGGAIKGRRLDVLFPTHEAAKKWGARRLTVTVWEYADGLPPDDFRKLRGVKRSWR
jgi:3D (Asp-Asp-Asp) domain-containing protein